MNDQTIKADAIRQTLKHCWTNMRTRCNNPRSEKYRDYGGRGITVCKEWSHFKDFYNWAILAGYKERLTLDRIDVNGNYCPENCRWATATQQARNTRVNRRIAYNGETHCVAEWAEIFGIPMKLLSARINKGWSMKDACSSPLRKHVKTFQRTCSVCGKRFTTTSYRAINCSKSCGYKKWYHKQKEGLHGCERKSAV